MTSRADAHVFPESKRSVTVLVKAAADAGCGGPVGERAAASRLKEVGKVGCGDTHWHLQGQRKTFGRWTFGVVGHFCL